VKEGDKYIKKVAIEAETFNNFFKENGALNITQQTSITRSINAKNIKLGSTSPALSQKQIKLIKTALNCSKESTKEIIEQIINQLKESNNHLIADLILFEEVKKLRISRLVKVVLDHLKAELSYGVMQLKFEQAVKYNLKSCVKFILSNFAKHIPDRFISPLLPQAVEKGHTEIALYIFKEARNKLLAKDIHYSLIRAIRKGNTKIVSLMLNQTKLSNSAKEALTITAAEMSNRRMLTLLAKKLV
jgi:hypothetical protein